MIGSQRDASFVASIRRFKETVNKQVDFIMQESLRNVCHAIIDSTPVDTGALVTNWLLSTNSPRYEAINEADPTRELARLHLSTVTKAVQFSNVVYYRNNLPYGPRIEYDGWSRYKSPRGMVRINVVNWVPLVELAKREGKYERFS